MAKPPTKSGPGAPPVYRPPAAPRTNGVLAVVQAKIAGEHLQRREQRAAPPVYRPQASGAAQRSPVKPSPSMPESWGVSTRPPSAPVNLAASAGQVRIPAAPRHTPVVQRAFFSNLFSGWGGGGKKDGGPPEKPQPEKREKETDEPSRDIIGLGEGRRCYVKKGDIINTEFTTSCGLVLAFGSENIAAYHWPKMSNSEEYRQIFRALVEEIGKIRKIEIYTSPISSDSRNDYAITDRGIRFNHCKQTKHYIYGNNPRGEAVTVTINSDGTGVASCSPSVTSVFDFE